MPPDNNDRRSNQEGGPGDFGIDFGAQEQGAGNEDGRRPRFAHILYISFRSAPNAVPKASASAIRNLVRVPAKDIDESDANCAICYEPMVDYDEPAEPEGAASEDPIQGKDELRVDAQSASAVNAGATGPEGALEGAPEGAPDAPGEPDADAPDAPPDEPPLNPDDHSGAALPCKHIFGRSCLHSWLRKAPSCPICRARVESEQGDDEPQHQMLDLNFDVVIPDSNESGAFDIRDLLRSQRISLPFAWRGGEQGPGASTSGAPAPSAAAGAEAVPPAPLLGRRERQHISMHIEQQAERAEQAHRARAQQRGDQGDQGAHGDAQGDATPMLDYMNVFMRTEASVRVATLRRRLRENRQRELDERERRQRDAQSSIYWNIFQRLVNHRRPEGAEGASTADTPAHPADTPAPVAPTAAASTDTPADASPSASTATTTGAATGADMEDTPMRDPTGQRRLGPRRREVQRRNPYSR